MAKESIPVVCWSLYQMPDVSGGAFVETNYFQIEDIDK